MTLTNQNPAARPRVLFVAETVTLAHAARPYMLATALKDLPYNVHMAWSPRYESLFKERPFVEHALHSISPDVFFNALSKGRPIFEADTLRQYVHEDLALLEKVKPDVVIGDLRLSLSVSARLRHVPYVALFDSYWCPDAEVRFSIPDHPLTRMIGVRSAQWLFDRARPFIFRQHAKPLNTVRREFGLPAIAGDIRHTYTDADETWYASLPSQTQMATPDAAHKFLGPMPWSPPMDVPAWWPDVPRDRPIVYISLGSSGRADLLPMIAHTVATMPVTVIIATAGAGIPENLPANVFAAPFLPGDRVNEIASLTIGNGGSPICQQALAHATPVLGIPSNLDQYMNMDGIVACGAGRCLRADQVNAQRIRTAVAGMLNDESLQHNARLFRDEIRRHPAEERFKTFLKKILVKSSGPPTTSTAA